MQEVFLQKTRGCIFTSKANVSLAKEGKVLYNTRENAGVMELVDVVDSKSTASDGVPVRVRPPAPKESPRMGTLFWYLRAETRTEGSNARICSRRAATAAGRNGKNAEIRSVTEAALPPEYTGHRHRVGAKYA